MIWKDSWSEIFDGTWLGNLEGWLVEIFGWTPAGGSGRNFGLKILERPPAGGIRRIFCWKALSEVIGGADGDVVGWSERGCHSVKRTVPGFMNVQIGCWVSSVDGQLIRGAETKVVRSWAPRGPH